MIRRDLLARSYRRKCSLRSAFETKESIGLSPESPGFDHLLSRDAVKLVYFITVFTFSNEETADKSLI